MDRRARALAAHLQRHSSRGDRALLLHPQGLDFVAAFFGCLYAGVLPVPLYPPSLSRAQRNLHRLRSVAQDAGATLALTSSELLEKTRTALERDPILERLQLLGTDRIEDSLADEWHDPGTGPKDLAFLQYTSGSTSDPKGVMVSHGNLLHNSEMLRLALANSESSVIVSWLPLFHDMGLIGNHLQAIYVGAPCVFMSPVHFLQKPARWLEAISRYGGTTSGGPSFAYELCVQRVSAEQRQALDLSRWATAFNGAETVRAATIRRFADAFGPCGFRAEAMFPCYGLAEATLLVAGKEQTQAPRIGAFSGAALQRHQVVPAVDGDADTQSWVGCGGSRLGQRIAIVDPETLEEHPPDRVGEIWVSGPSVAQGYWGRPQDSESVFRARTRDGRGPFLRTGDLGFCIGDELFVSGRRKDLLIIRGQNHYPQDIEWTVQESHPALLPGEGAAFSVDLDGEEHLVVVQEIRRNIAFDLEEIAGAVREAVSSQYELDLHALVLLARGRLPKTSSGKVQRSACRAAYLEGGLQPVATWRQDLAPVGARPPAASSGPAAPDAETIERWLVSRLAARLGAEGSGIDVRKPFAAYGLGSLAMIGLTGELEEWLGRRLSPLLLYENPDAAQLARVLAGEAFRRDVPRMEAELRHEPVAIVGIGCRLPGARDARAFWQLLCDGVDAIREVPGDRWPLDTFYDPDPAKPGTMNTRWGGFLDGVDQFDPAFFGISPREASRIDPQQRLLLEVAWEALEDAGQTPERLASSRTGVFVGISTSDYSRLQLGDPALIDAYAGTGNALSIAANRISYLLDLHGPSMAVDTACSSSLVAVYLACQSLWNGDSELCLAGGVNLILSPAITINFSKAGVMAPDGRCKAFDASGDGYVRGEGAGFVVLKPLSRALADGDPVHAVIRGGAVNQDGRTNGLMAPNGKAQEAVLREAYRRSGVAPDRVRYVESHGTGTFLGDPIEANALGTVLGEGRSPEESCFVGSVKTNFGHLEAAAGVAGLIKTALVLEHRWIPPNLHFHTPNPHIDFERLRLRVPTAPAPWPAGEGPALAGVSSLGFGGVNAHLVLEEPPAPAEATEEAEGPRLFTLSGHTPEALRARAKDLSESLAADGADGDNAAPGLADLCYTANVRRGHLDYRLAAVAGSRAELADRLAAFVAGESLPGLSAPSHAAASRCRPIFLFPGQGGQWAGMGRELVAREPVFRDAILSCARAMEPYVDWPLLAELESGSVEIDRIQPALFSVQVALAALWRSWGIEPAGVVGHSMGEVAAAHVAGALSLEDACRIICARSRLLRRTSGQGAMAVVGLGLEEARQAVAGHEDQVSVAVSNSPRTTVLSGDPETLRQLLAALETRDVFCRFVKVDVASHSPQMDPLRDELLRALEEIRPRAGSLPFFSTVTGEPADGAGLGPGYWVENLRQPVLFSTTVERLLADGRDVFVEVNPHPILLSSVQEVMAHLTQPGREGITLPSLYREQPELEVMLGSLGALHTLGARVDWRRLHPRGRCVPLPTYPWQRERHWLEVPRAGLPPLETSAPAAHPLLGPSIRSAGSVLWQAEIDRRTLPFLDDHRVQGEVVLPGAAYIEMALAAARSLGYETPTLDEVEIGAPLVLGGETRRVLQLVLTTEAPEGFRIYSRPAGSEEGAWTLHASGKVRRTATAPETPGRSLADLQAACPEEVEPDALYRALAARGLEYGPRFQGIVRVRRRDGEALAELRAPASLTDEPGGYGIHPALLDAAWQTLAAALPDGLAAGDPYVIAGLGRATLLGRCGERLWSHASVRAGALSQDLEGDVRLLDETGRVVLDVAGLRLRRLGASTREQGESRDGWLHELEWRPQALATALPRSAAGLLVFSDGHFGPHLPDGAPCTLVFPGLGYHRQDASTFEIDPARPEHYRQLLGEAAADPQRPLHVVHLWSLDVQGAEAGPLAGWLSALHLVQALAAEAAGPVRLWLVTAGAQPVGGAVDLPGLFQAPLWGLARTIQQEHPDLRCSIVDLSPGAPVAEARLLGEEIAADLPEDQIALRGDLRYVVRLIRSRPSPAGEMARLRARAGRDAFRLEVETPGILDTLTLRACSRPPPAYGEVEIEVRAGALNFMDVMKAMGMQPGAAGSAIRLGGECAGRIVAVGGGVEGLRAGDEVVALAPYSFGSFVNASAELAALRPAGLDWDQAASLPIAFLTAEYTLRHLARLGPGERVLIHAAAGGVGLAAVQVAQRLGAEIFATAGTPEKRQLLQSLGVRHLLSSRSLAFADELLELTGGQGVDVVLNSLAGEFLSRSLSCLAPYGRFVEIGKRDIYQNGQLGLLPFQRNLSFFAVDLEKMADERPALLGSLLAEVLDGFRQGVYRPLPLRAFPLSDAAEAFRYLAQARHVGKVVLTLNPDEEVPVAPPAAGVRTEATYLITGGLGGLGLTTAAWMASRGAKSLVLVGRGAASATAEAALETLRRNGVQVRVAAIDVAREEQVAALLAEMERDLPPLRGVVHAAGVLDDGILLELDQQRFEKVMAAKLAGAWNLHSRTAGMPLDFFVLFSSAASVLGSPGQGNYAAANAFLDALAHYRRAHGLPALAINWGPWAEVGLAARPGRGGVLAARGIRSILPGAGAEVLERLLREDRPQVTVLPADWREVDARAARPVPLLTELVAAVTAAPRGAGALSREALAAAPPKARRDLLEAHLCALLARIVGLAGTRVDPRQPLVKLGVDSLMAVELKNRVEAGLGVVVPVVRLLEAPSVAELTDLVLERLEETWSPVQAPASTSTAEAGEWEVLRL